MRHFQVKMSKSGKGKVRRSVNFPGQQISNGFNAILQLTMIVKVDGGGRFAA